MDVRQVVGNVLSFLKRSDWLKINTNTYRSENENDLIVFNIRNSSFTPYEFFTAWYALARTTATGTTTPENNDLIG